MATELELLNKDIPRLEKRYGSNNPFVQLLKSQVSFLQNKLKSQSDKSMH
jgi:hypothetical protein